MLVKATDELVKSTNFYKLPNATKPRPSPHAPWSWQWSSRIIQTKTQRWVWCILMQYYLHVECILPDFRERERECESFPTANANITWTYLNRRTSLLKTVEKPWSNRRIIELIERPPFAWLAWVGHGNSTRYHQVDDWPGKTKKKGKPKMETRADRIKIDRDKHKMVRWPRAAVTCVCVCRIPGLARRLGYPLFPYSLPSPCLVVPKQTNKTLINLFCQRQAK